MSEEKKYSWFTNHAQSRSIKAEKGVIAVLDISAKDAAKVCEVLEYETAPLLATIQSQAQEIERYKQFLADMRPLFISLEGVTCIYFGFGDKPTPTITSLRPDKMLEVWNDLQNAVSTAREGKANE